MKWLAIIKTVNSNEDGTQELEIIEIIESENLRTVYRKAMSTCKWERDAALAAIYKGISMEDAARDDATKKETKCEYQISKGEMGAITVWGRNHKKLCEIRENR